MAPPSSRWTTQTVFPPTLTFFASLNAPPSGHSERLYSRLRAVISSRRRTSTPTVMRPSPTAPPQKTLPCRPSPPSRLGTLVIARASTPSRSLRSTTLSAPRTALPPRVPRLSLPRSSMRSMAESGRVSRSLEVVA